jgi:DNA repair photolyase
MQAEIKNFAQFYGHSNCFYPLVVDTYQGVCPVGCSYCYSQQSAFGAGKFQGLALDSIEQIFVDTFDKDLNCKFSPWLKQRVPLRIGGFVECFPAMEKEQKRTLHLLQLLKKYDYPALIITKSDLILAKEYVELLDPKRIAIQVSIGISDATMMQKIEPQAATKQQRLAILRYFNRHGFFTTARINPLFPIFVDGHFSEQRSGEKLEIFSTDLFKEIKAEGTVNCVAGFVHLDQQQLQSLSKLLAIDLAQWMSVENRERQQGFIYDPEELKLYFAYLKQVAQQEGIEFSPCYLGQGDNFFSSVKHLFCDAGDCCNLQQHIQQINSFAQIADSWTTRLAKFIIKQATGK